jgi:hypothetical protein
MPVERHKPTRSFGAGDQPICPRCGKTMSLSRRTPHSEHGQSYERQTFTCRECSHDIERSVNKRGMRHEWAVSFGGLIHCKLSYLGAI